MQAETYKSSKFFSKEREQVAWSYTTDSKLHTRTWVSWHLDHCCPFYIYFYTYCRGLNPTALYSLLQSLDQLYDRVSEDNYKYQVSEDNPSTPLCVKGPWLVPLNTWCRALTSHSFGVGTDTDSHTHLCILEPGPMPSRGVLRRRGRGNVEVNESWEFNFRTSLFFFFFLSAVTQCQNWFKMHFPPIFRGSASRQTFSKHLFRFTTFCVLGKKDRKHSPVLRGSQSSEEDWCSDYCDPGWRYTMRGCIIERHADQRQGQRWQLSWMLKEMSVREMTRKGISDRGNNMYKTIEWDGLRKHGPRHRKKEIGKC